MIKSVAELKELIIWAKSQKVKSLKIGEIAVEISELATLEGIQDLGAPEQKSPDLTVPPTSPRLAGGNQESSEDEELLYWSVNKG